MRNEYNPSRGSEAHIKFLIIRRDNIGDLVCTTPIFSILRKNFPDSEIAVLVNSYNADVLHRNPYLDNIYIYKKLKHSVGVLNKLRAIIERLKLILKIRYWKPTFLILAKSSYDYYGLKFARQIGTGTIIGYAPNSPEFVNTLPDVALPPPSSTECHEVEAISRLLAPLNVFDSPGRLEVFPDARVAKKFISLLGDDDSYRIAIHISAREASRRWGVMNYIYLINHILHKYNNAKIILLWAPGIASDPCHPGDDSVAQRITLQNSDPRLIPVYTTSLIDLIAAISTCDMFIGVDSGAMHLAAAQDKSVLALFENSPSKLKHWYPWCANNKIVFGNSLNVDSILPERVIATLDDMLISTNCNLQ